MVLDFQLIQVKILPDFAEKTMAEGVGVEPALFHPLG